MARGSTLSTLLTMTKAKSLSSTNPAHQVSMRDTYVDAINEAQFFLWSSFDWPFLESFQSVDISGADTDTFALPDGVTNESVEEVRMWHNDQAYDLEYDVNTLDWDEWFPRDRFNGATNLGPQTYADPAKFELLTVSEGGEEVDKIRIWPFPTTVLAPGSQLLLKTKRVPPTMADDDDVCLLDDHMVSLYAAGAIAAGRGDRRGESLIARSTEMARGILRSSDKAHKTTFSFLGPKTRRFGVHLTTPKD